MKTSLLALVPVLACLCLSSCLNSANKDLLAGDWVGVEWLSEGQASSNDPTQAHFHFDKDGTYSSDFGGTKEKGTYLVRGDELYTTPDGQLEIMVKIAKINKDSVVFDMNRSGSSETLTMVRSK